MKKTSLSLTLITTFLLGFFVFAIWQFKDSSLNSDVSLPNIVEENVCSRYSDFPGRSLDLNTIKVNKYGYFPDKLFGWEKDYGWNERLDDLRNKWYSTHLKAMDESPLFGFKEAGAEIYRFLWLRSFDNPVIVNIRKDDGGFWLNYKKLSGAGGYEPGEIRENKTLALTPVEWCEFQNLLEKADYWKLETDEKRIGNDGSRWIFEAVKDSRYHVVDRWSPEDGAYRNAGLYLLRLSGFKPESADEIY